MRATYDPVSSGWGRVRIFILRGISLCVIGTQYLVNMIEFLLLNSP